MRKLYLSILLIMTAAFIPLLSAAEVNLVTNAGFEEGKIGASWTTGTISGWSWKAGTCWEVQNYFVHSGSQATKIWDPSVEIYQDFSASGGAEYVIAAFAYTPSNDQLEKMDSALKVEWYSKGSKISSEEIGWFYGLGSSRGTPDPIDKWKLLSKTVTAPLNADTGRVCFHFANQPEGWKGAVVWDDISVVLKKVLR